MLTEPNVSARTLRLEIGDSSPQGSPTLNIPIELWSPDLLSERNSASN